jgi:uncharacterized membrane protein
MATTRREVEKGGDGRQEQSGRPPARGARSGGRQGRRGAGGVSKRPRNAQAALQQLGLGDATDEQLARGLGWFSIGLGLAEVLAPGGIAKIAGARKGNRTLVRLLGLREIAHGIAILSHRRPVAAVWSRVAGDALDLGVLAGVYASPGSNKALMTFATANVLTVTALDVITAQLLGRGDNETADGGVPADASVIINRSPEEVYRFWRDLENLPTFMHHLESVRETGEGRSHWVAKGPLGKTVEWDAEITEDRPGELISWRSLEGADVDNSGTVRFEEAPGGRGTIIQVELSYHPPGGTVGSSIAMLFGEEPMVQMRSDLRRLKQVLETGEVVLSDASLYGTAPSQQRPAQPPEEVPPRA